MKTQELDQLHAIANSLCNIAEELSQKADALSETGNDRLSKNLHDYSTSLQINTEKLRRITGKLTADTVNDDWQSDTLPINKSISRNDVNKPAKNERQVLVNNKMCDERQVLVEYPEYAIGKYVCKYSGKPFKSGNKANRVQSVTINPNTGRKAFTFHDDDSIVDVVQCEIFKLRE